MNDGLVCPSPICLSIVASQTAISGRVRDIAASASGALLAPVTWYPRSSSQRLSSPRIPGSGSTTSTALSIVSISSGILPPACRD